MWSRILENSPNFSKNSCYDKALQESIPDDAIIKKANFSLFGFSLKQILGSERKRLNCHRRLVSFILFPKKFF